MVGRKPFITLSFFLWGTFLAAAPSSYRLCASVRIQGNGKERIEFSDTEKRLICGSEGEGPWSRIPMNQAIFNVTNFLQDTGYFRPTFSREGDVLVIHTGEPTKVTGLLVNDGPRDVDFTRLRKIIGQRLQPKLLDDVQTRVERFLQTKGYACPKLKLNANPETGVITVDVTAGKKLPVLGVAYEPVDGFETDMLKRYRAFQIGELYNPDYLQVTANRILDDNILQSTHFTTKCENDGVQLSERSVAGPPRIVSIGIGLDTEQIVIGRVAWKNSRLGSYGSQVQVSASGSALLQQLELIGQWYYSDFLSRHYLRPSIQLRHDNFIPIEDLVASIGLAPALSADSQNTSVTMYAGPTVLITKVLRGAGAELGVQKQLTLSGQMRVADHYYEYYRTAPRTGFQVTLDGLLAQQNVLSNVTAYRFDLHAEKLWNVGHFEPPLLVFGVRAGYGTTLTPEAIGSGKLTPAYRHFLGGSTDMRGFGRQELSNNVEVTDAKGTRLEQQGMLTHAFLSGELRLVETLPFGIQPFLFLDGGALGLEPLKLNEPFFLSPGLGVRLQTQIGVIRSTISHGYYAGNRDYRLQFSEHPQFYFSFGEEF